MGEFTLALPRIPDRTPASRPKVIFTTKPPPDPDEETTKDLVVIAGGQATFITLNFTYSSNVNKQVQKETQRTSDLVRIKNPAKPEQHVDVMRPTEVRTSPPRGQTGPNAPSSMKIIYMPQPETETVEVLEEEITEKNPEWEDGGGGAAP
jgi:hypothetical protein